MMMGEGTRESTKTRHASAHAIGSCLIITLLFTIIGVHASVAAGTELCPNQQVRSESRTGPLTELPLSDILPECRAYEQVTPSFKDGPAEIKTKAISPDGSHLLVRAVGNFGDAINSQSQSGSTYELTRTSNGWAEHAADLPPSQFPWDELYGASTDLSRTLWAARGTTQSVYAKDLIVRESDGTVRDLGPVSPSSETEGPAGLGSSATGGIKFDGASSELTHILFGVPPSEGDRRLLWPGDTTVEANGNESLYEHSGLNSSEPKLVGVRNVGQLKNNDEAELIGECGVSAGAARGLHTEGAISRDGSTVFFTPTGADDNGNECSGAQPPVDELYTRVDGEKTVDISEPILPAGSQCTETCASAPRADAIFQGASASGSKVFFLTSQPLLNSDADGTTDLYEAELEGGANAHIIKLSQISLDPASNQAGEVLGVAHVSEDGNRIYFVARSVLAANTTGLGQAATVGSDNLYVYNGVNQQTQFVATLSEVDQFDWSLSGSGFVQTTPTGAYLVFPSVEDLTSDDSSRDVSQLFRYDAENGELVRISAGKSGFNFDGNTNEFEGELPFLESFGSAKSGLAMAENGAVVFQSADGLTPEALNGQVETYHYQEGQEARSGTYYATNIYQYTDGGVALLSDGFDTTATHRQSSVTTIGTTTTDDDVFFTTADQLVQQDTDTVQDIYDARIDGGFPGSTAAPACEGEGCQAPAVVPASPVSPTSVTSVGSGNDSIQAPSGTMSRPPSTMSTAQLRAQKLKVALTVCRRSRGKTRKSCEARAKRQYGTRPAKKIKKSSRRGK